MSRLEEAKWYVVQTYSGYEDKVASSILTVAKNYGLEDDILEIKVPKKEIEEIKDGKKRLVSKKVYPSYVFAKVVLSDDLHQVVSRRNIKGCLGFVGNPPSPLKKQEIEKFGIEKPKEVVVPYKIGDTVQITEENLGGVSGVVKNIDLKKQIVEVLVSMFGRETLIELQLEDVVPIK